MLWLKLGDVVVTVVIGWKFFILLFVYGAVVSWICYRSGFKQGKIQGMKEFISLIRIYDTKDKKILTALGDMFKEVNCMSKTEKEKALKASLERYIKSVDDE